MGRRINHSVLSCDDGRLMRRDPQPDDPYLETDLGQCEECGGRGCNTDHCESEEDDDLGDDPLGDWHGRNE